MCSILLPRKQPVRLDSHLEFSDSLDVSARSGDPGGPPAVPAHVQPPFSSHPGSSPHHSASCACLWSPQCAPAGAAHLPKQLSLATLGLGYAHHGHSLPPQRTNTGNRPKGGVTFFGGGRSPEYALEEELGLWGGTRGHVPLALRTPHPSEERHARSSFPKCRTQQGGPSCLGLRDVVLSSRE